MAYPALAPSDIFEVTIKGTLFGQRTENTFHYTADVVVGDQTMLDVFTNFVVHFEDEYTAAVSNDWSGHEVTVRRITPQPTRAIPFTIAWTGTGGVGTNPPSTTGVISRVSWQSGRRSLGRIFVPAVPLLWHVEGKLSLGGITAYGALAAKMGADIVESGNLNLQPIIWNPPVGFRDVELCIVRPILRQQRRREIDVGI